jgi:phosphoketolase
VQGGARKSHELKREREYLEEYVRHSSDIRPVSLFDETTSTLMERWYIAPHTREYLWKRLHSKGQRRHEKRSLPGFENGVTNVQARKQTIVERKQSRDKEDFEQGQFSRRL